MPKEAINFFFLISILLMKQVWYNSERTAREMTSLNECNEHNLLAEASTIMAIVLFWKTS